MCRSPRSEGNFARVARWLFTCAVTGLCAWGSTAAGSWNISSANSLVGIEGSSQPPPTQTIAVDFPSSASWELPGSIDLPVLPLAFNENATLSSAIGAVGSLDVPSGVVTLSLPFIFEDPDGVSVALVVQLTTEAPVLTPGNLALCPGGAGNQPFCEGTRRDPLTGELRLVGVVEIPPDSGTSLDGSSVTFELSGNLQLGGLNLPPEVTISAPPADVTIASGAIVNFAGDWDDPDGGLGSATFAWTFPACASITASSIEDPGPVSFDCPIGDYLVTFQVCDSGGACGLALRGVSVDAGNAAPLVSIDQPSADLSILSGESVAFSLTASDADGPPPLSFDWDFTACASPSTSALEDPGAVLFLCAAGPLVVSVEVCDGLGACRSATRTIIISGNLPPVISIDAPATNVTTSAGSPVLFASTATDNDGPAPLSFFWSFGGCASPSTSAVEDPGFVSFAACPAGDYLVTLNVCDAGFASCSQASRTISVGVGVAPDAEIVQPASDVTIIPGQSVIFAGAYDDDDNPLGTFTFSWTFPACAVPKISSLEDPGSVLFNCPVGDYVAHFLVCDETDLCGDDTRQIFVRTANAPPVVAIDDPPAGLGVTVYAGDAVNFAATVTDADGPTPLTLAWTFPACASPTSSGVEDPGPVVFNCAPGSYAASLEACDGLNACTFEDRAIEVVTNLPPVPTIGSPASALVQVLPGNTVFFSGGATDGDGPPPLTLQWIFGSCAVPTESTVSTPGSVAFPCPPGDIDVTLTACDGAGACATEHRTVRVLAGRAPIVIISEPPSDTSVERGGLISFAGDWTDPDGLLGDFEFNWSFPACAVPSTSSVEDPGVVRFDCEAGDYPVSFEVCDATDLCSSDSRTITVIDSGGFPTAVIDLPSAPISVSGGDVVEFAGTGEDLDGPLPLNYLWTFPACASITSSTVEDPGGVLFACPGGDYDVTFRVCNAATQCAFASVTVSVVAPACAALPTAGWQLVFADSQELIGENGAAVNAFDNNPATIWHTRWSGANPPLHPHEIRIDTGVVRSMCGFSYLPRQDGSVNGTVRSYEFAVSADGISWTTVASGELVISSANLSERHVTFATTNGRYIRLRALSAVNGGPWTSVAELRLRGGAPIVANPPLVVIDQPAVNVTVSQGDSVHFASTATDPDGPLPLQYTWSFPSCALPPTSNLEDPGPVAFSCLPGDYTATLQVCDAGGACASAQRTISVLGLTCSELPRTGWSVTFFDSQELIGENGAATNAIDGQASTHWTTQWVGANPPHPHELRVDTAAVRTLCGFRYLPRQDGGVNGTIRHYEFAVSLDGINWSTVSSGVLVSSTTNLAARVVHFSPTPARHVRLRALSEVRGGPWTTLAELGVLGTTSPASLPPIVSIDQPVHNVTLLPGESQVFTATATDPDGELPLSLTWTFPACAIPSTSIIEDPGPVVFDCDPGDYGVIFQACDAGGRCASASRQVTILGPGCSVQPQTGFAVVGFDSEELVGEDGRAVNAIDDNPLSHWTTQWVGANPPHPHEIRIDTGSTRTMCGFNYLPRQDGGINGTIRDYEFAVSNDGNTWTTVSSGVLLTNAADLSERSVDFPSTVGRYVRLRALSEINGQPWTAVAELRIKATAGSGSFPPVAQIDLPTGDASIVAGAPLEFAGTSFDPDDELPLSRLWTFPACASPSSSALEDPGQVVFNCPAGKYSVEFRVCDAGGLCASVMREITVLSASCVQIAQVGWTLAGVSSQELTGENGAATNAFDSSAATIWHSRWTGANPPAHPHEIRIDTGAARTLCGFSYVPRQDGGTNGKIRNYEFAVSSDGTNWTTVANGTLITAPGDASERSVDFAPTLGRYIRLRALSSANGDRYASAAEIRLRGAP